jgi:hypothetical protein
MRLQFRLITTLVITFLGTDVRAGGMPVVDTNELVKQVSDSLYLLTSIETLLGEINENGAAINTMSELREEINLYNQAVRDYERLSGSVEDASYYDGGRSKVLSDQINSVTRHIRKLKTVVSLATTIGARPEAMNASLQILRDERQREREKFEVALKAVREKEKIKELRRKITRKTRLKRSLNQEIEEIGRLTQNKSVKPVSFKRAGNEMGQLW